MSKRCASAVIPNAKFNQSRRRTEYVALLEADFSNLSSHSRYSQSVTLNINIMILLYNYVPILLQLVWQAREAGAMCALFIISSTHKKEDIENLFKLVLCIQCDVKKQQTANKLLATEIT